ncbi:hypothetical protein [Novosphingobium sp. PhB165]|nr:hypothetical protein [Novosphingobium sp. PhB165]
MKHISCQPSASAAARPARGQQALQRYQEYRHDKERAQDGYDFMHLICVR